MTLAFSEACHDEVRHISKGTRASTEIDAHVGLMVKLRRLDLNLSQEFVAAKLGITAQQLKKYEKGTNRIGASRLHQLATILDVEIQYFFQNTPATQGELNAPDKESTAHSSLFTTLEDSSAVRLLQMFASIEDHEVKNRVLSLVQAIVVRN